MATNRDNRPLVTIVVDVAAADVDSDASGDVTVVITDLREVVSAIGDIQGGYVATRQAISANSVTFRIFRALYGGGAAGPLVAHTSATDIAIMTVTAFGYR